MRPFDDSSSKVVCGDNVTPSRIASQPPTTFTHRLSTEYTSMWPSSTPNNGPVSVSILHVQADAAVGVPG